MIRPFACPQRSAVLPGGLPLAAAEMIAAGLLISPAVAASAAPAAGGAREVCPHRKGEQEHERGYVLIYDGHAWSEPLRVEGQLELTSVSCPSASFGAPVGDASTGVETFAGYTLTCNGRSWRRPALRVKGSIERDQRAFELELVSCASPSFCVITNQAGEVLIYNGSSWSELVARDSKGRLTSLACPSPSLCVAVGTVYRPEGVYREGEVPGEAFAMSFDGSSWSAPKTLELAGIPTVYGRVGRSGAFSARAAIPARAHPGAYTISGRRGGGNLGVFARLRVLLRKREIR